MRKSLDLTGMRFGRLVAEYKTSKRDYKGSVYWHCRCDCGNEIDVPADGLRTGNNLSCGCLKRMNQKHINETLHLVDGTCLDWRQPLLTESGACRKRQVSPKSGNPIATATCLDTASTPQARRSCGGGRPMTGRFSGGLPRQVFISTVTLWL